MPIDLTIALSDHRRGQLDQAERVYDRALAEDPGRDEALHLLGLIKLQRGDPGQALALIARAIALRADLADYHAGLAEAYWALGQIDRAVSSGREAVRLDPTNPARLCNLGASLVDQDNLDLAIDLFGQAIRLQPDFAAAHNNMGNALRLRGDLSGALASFRDAVRLEPGSSEAQANLGKILLDRGEADEALGHCREASRLRPNSLEARINLGQVYQVLGRLAEAEVILRDAVRLRPDSASAQASLGGVLEQLGHSEQAMATLHQALQIDPNHAGVLARLATRLRGKLATQEQAAIERLLANPGLPDDQRLPMLYGLAHVCEARGDFDRAAALTVEANARQRDGFERAGLGYDPVEHSRFVTALIDGFDAGFFERIQGWGLATDRPVFIVGMPRSGTSLVEQILASHPQVFGAGELGVTGQTFAALGIGLGPNPSLRDCLDHLDRPSLIRLASQHLDILSGWNDSADRVADKMPENLLYLGLIAALFPKAKLIHCRRDVRDIALSCWMTHFGQVRWSCDPNHIAGRIAEAARVMDHWRRTLPVSIFEISYEDLINNLEEKSRELVAWCGLDWNPGCLEFHKIQRTVRTASLAQVRQPIYRGSIGRWKHYEMLLPTLFQAISSS